MTALKLNFDVRCMSRLLQETLCYNLDLEHTPKAYVLKVWFAG
jgi:hypothetical protein